MNQTITIGSRKINVSFTNYYDSALGDFYFQQVMCDVFLPGNEVVPVAVEKEQIRLVVEGFKLRKELYEEIRKEDVKGKSYYVITPAMRFDLKWMKGKPTIKLSKDLPPQEVYEESAPVAEPRKAEPAPARTFGDARRKFLLAKGFAFNEAANNWLLGGIRFPDALVDKSASDDAFALDMNRLVEADLQSRGKRKTRK